MRSGFIRTVIGCATLVALLAPITHEQSTVDALPDPVAPESVALEVPNDLSGDGTSDLVWTDRGGHLAIWIVRDGQIVDSATYYVGTEYRLVGIGDVDGDLRDDLIWQRSAAHGNAIAIWGMDGADVIRTVGIPVIGDSWVAEAVADVDGDGYPDIVFQSTASSGTTYKTMITLAVWYLHGFTVEHEQWGTYPLGFTEHYALSGSGDFDGDGAVSLIYQTALPSLKWYTVDFPRGEAPAFAEFNWWTGHGWGIPGWFARLNDDATTDAYWQWDGFSPAARPLSAIEYYLPGQSNVVQHLPTYSADLRFLGFGDFDGTGRADFVWAYCNHLAVWLNNGDGTWTPWDFGPYPFDSSWGLFPLGRPIPLTVCP